ncbi:MAG: DNA polymerase III subunit delta [bacterium]
MSRADDRRELFKQLKAGNLATVYYIHGPDPFMLDSAVDAIVQAAAPEGLNAFNHDKFRGKDASGERVRAAAEQLPFMVPRRIVILRNVEEMPTKEFDALADYFENPSDTTVMVVHSITANKSLDGRSSAVKKMRKAAKEYEFKSFYENEITDFLRRKAHEKGLRLSDEAMAHLIEACGTDLSPLVDALERVDLYLGVGAAPREVDVDTVRNVVAHTRVHSVFTLTDALGGRDFERALQVLATMLESGESALGLMRMIARHFRILAKLHDPEIRAMSDRNQKARAVGVVVFFLGRYQQDAGRFSRRELEGIREALLEADIALKSSRISDRVLMEDLLHTICFRRQEVV